VKHKPRRLLSDPDGLGDLATTDAILAIEDHPHGSEPLVQRDGGILHDGSDLDGELTLGMMGTALPDAAFGMEFHLVRSTCGAKNAAIRPSPYRQVINTVIRIREVYDCFLQALWFGHGLILHDQNYSLNRWMSQVNYHRN